MNRRQQASRPTSANHAKSLYPAALSAAIYEVIALAIRGNPLKFHRLGADHTGHERYEWALVIIHSASNSLRNRSFLPKRRIAAARAPFDCPRPIEAQQVRAHGRVVLSHLGSGRCRGFGGQIGIRTNCAPRTGYESRPSQKQLRPRGITPHGLGWHLSRSSQDSVAAEVMSLAGNSSSRIGEIINPPTDRRPYLSS